MADKIVAEYIVKTDKAVAELNKVVGRLDKIDKERQEAQKGFKSMSKGMVNDFKNIGAAIGVAFGAQELVSFGKEAVKLASQMEGVERAFKRIGGANSANLLEGLRRATRGTVSDLQLMQKAVQASNFKIPLENLASLFKFAQARARETGESVEYLTNSIVLGIGRKSPLILDNLGISAVELRNRLKGVGVEASSVGDIAKIIGDIAEEELAKMGDQVDTTADKMEQLASSTENLKAALGSLITETAEPALDFFTKLSTAISNDITEFSRFKESLKGESGLSLLNKLTEETTKLTELETEATEKAGKVRDAEFNKIKERVDFQRRLVGAIKEELDARVSNSVEQEITVDLINKETEAYRKLLEEQKEVIKNLAYYNQLIKDLQAEQADANTTRERVRQLEDEINEAVRQRNLLLGKLSKEQKEQIELEERLRKIREISWTQMSSIGYPVTRSLTDTLAGLNRLLKEQQQILNNAPEFSKQYNDAANSIDRLNKKIKEFSDSQIDPNEGFPEFAPDGEMSATGQGLLPDPKTLEIRLNESLDLFRGFAGSVQSIYASIAQMQQNAFIRQEQELQRQLEKGEITREEFEQKQRELQRKSAQAAKDAALFNAVINTAQAVMQALANTPPPASYALAAVAGALGAAQIAAIASQPLPQFAEGGFVNQHGEIIGRSHAQGGVLIEAEGNEFITKGKYAQQNADILKAINSGDWEKYKMENIIAPAINQVLEGGFQGLGASYMLNTNWTDRNLLKQGDRNRYAMRDGFIYLGKKIDGLNGKRNRWS